MPRFTENVADGFFALDGGMNSATSPSLIPPNQYAFGVNVTNRDAFLRTRPRFRQLSIDWAGNEDAQNWFENNPISGQTYFQASNGQPSAVCCAGGRFFAAEIDGTMAHPFEFTPQGPRNDRYQTITWFCQAANLLVAQNGEDIPVIFDGASGRRSNILANEVPVGRQMGYINNRLFVVAPNMREIFPGDLAYATPTSAVTFTEINENPGGGPLSVPLEIGGITGVIVTAQTNTAAGQGTLLVATERAVSSINPIVQRNLWNTIQLQSIALIGNGYSGNGLTVVNGDVWGRSVDGFRSYIMAQRNFINYSGSTSWGNTPQSREISRIIQDDEPSLLKYSSVVYFDNRLLCTVGPQVIANGLGCYHLGIASLNFDGISTLTQKSTPCWEGLWTGVTPYGFLTGKFDDEERCLMFSFNAETGKNELWEITKDYGDDLDKDDVATRIEASFESRSCNFESPYNPKELQATEIFADSIVGTVDFSLQYRPDQYPCWLDYKTWTECAGTASCDPVGLVGMACVQPIFTAPQFRPRMDLGKPPRSCDPVLMDVNYRGYEFQLRLSWTGQARVRTGIMMVNKRDVNATVKC